MDRNQRGLVYNGDGFRVFFGFLSSGFRHRWQSIEEKALTKEALLLTNQSLFCLSLFKRSIYVTN
jgi:hypothetical protein